MTRKIKEGKIVVLTGAGVSAESGIPTFRDVNGLWKRFPVRDLATPAGWKENPRRVLVVGTHLSVYRGGGTPQAGSLSRGEGYRDPCG